MTESRRCISALNFAVSERIALTFYTEEVEQQTSRSLRVLMAPGKPDRQAALAAGFQHHLSKPIEPGRLVLLVATLTGRTSADR